MRTWTNRHCIVVVSRFKSLARVDSRMFEIYSLVAKVAWAVGFCLLTPYTSGSSFGRASQFLPSSLGLLLIPFAAMHFAAILLNQGRIRRACLLVGIGWWAWLSSLMWQFPPNLSACITYGLISAVGVWAYIAARLRGEVS
jgi:hypothetical protein